MSINDAVNCGSSRFLRLCPTDAAFEAWQITEPGGWRFVSLPGGALGVWSASAVNV
ncbi:DUF6188 family protein [Streptomyces sp. CBMA29]|uniref:DUF6188 family protein n=1 Tax=Streptomyces sp. CBMA29 TaxID=1896314 RepID=UPI00397F809A